MDIPVIRKVSVKLQGISIMKAEDGTTHIRPYRRSGAMCGYDLGKKHKVIKKMDYISCEICKTAMRYAMEFVDNPRCIEEATKTAHFFKTVPWHKTDDKEYAAEKECNAAMIKALCS